MKTDEFLKWIAANTLRIDHYQHGKDGSGGGCDCIGLIIGAWRLAGKTWPWTHGSNYAARHRVRNLATGQLLQLGDLVFKARPPGSAGYSLPDTYKNDPDRNDYYHVGIVTAVDPLTITHCTSVDGGIKEDHSRGQWTYSGQLNLLEDETMTSTKYVYATKGKTVNLRKSAKLTAGLVKSIPIGTQVEILGSTSTGWDAVQWGDLKGYMLQKFLVEELPEDGTETPGKDTDIDKARTALYKAREEIDKALAEISPAG